MTPPAPLTDRDLARLFCGTLGMYSGPDEGEAVGVCMIAVARALCIDLVGGYDVVHALIVATQAEVAASDVFRPEGGVN